MKIFRNSQFQKICPQFEILNKSALFREIFSGTPSDELQVSLFYTLNTIWVSFSTELIENIIDRKIILLVKILKTLHGRCLAMSSHFIRFTWKSSWRKTVEDTSVSLLEGFEYFVGWIYVVVWDLCWDWWYIMIQCWYIFEIYIRIYEFLSGFMLICAFYDMIKFSWPHEL